MKKLCLLGLAIGLASHSVWAGTTPAGLENKDAFIGNLMKQMTLDEKIGQLRLISIGPEMPREKIREEIAAGRIGGTFNSITRDENRPMQDAAMRGRLKIPMFFAYDVIHGHRTIFPISLGLAASYTFYGVCAVISFFLVRRFIHETKGKELEQMEGWGGH